MLRSKDPLTVRLRILRTAPTRPLHLPTPPARFTVSSNRKLTVFGRFTVVPLVIPISQATGVDSQISVYAFRRDN